jgi:MFS family permease
MSADESPLPAVAPGLRWRLSTMMFLQYAIWGCWAPILFLHLGSLADFTRPGVNTAGLISWVYMTMAIASMIAPAAGQLADRNFATQRFLAFSHFVGGLLIFWLFWFETFTGIFFILLLHTLLYAPTVGLTNSITLHHLPKEEFGRIRLWGTIGWIVISWVFSVWLGLADGLIEAINPEWKVALVDFRRSLPDEFKPKVGHCLLTAGALSVVLALFCLFLPHTPPTKSRRNPFAFLSGFKLMAKPSFAVLIVVAFIVSTELQFYYVLTPGFFNQGGGPFEAKEVAVVLAKDLDEAKVNVEETAMAEAQKMLKSGDKNGDNKLSVEELREMNTPEAARVLKHYAALVEEKGGVALDQAWVGPVMTFGQIAEVIVLLFVPFALRQIGFRGMITLGILAWSIRYFIFSLGQPRELVLLSQSLHGFGFGFFFVGAFLYADKIAPPDTRASVQSFIIFVTYGAGMVVSSLLAGPVVEWCDKNWHYVFLVPAAITLVCSLAFAVFFREEGPAE